MSTYYRYAERDVENQINWAEIGKNVTDMLSTEVELREKKKAEIDSATNQYADVLANQPIGQNQAYNKFIVNFTDNASEARLMQDRLLRSGQLKLKDYNLMRQNLSQGTDQFFQIAKEYNTAYEEKIKRLEDGDSAQLEQFIMEQAESFGNFANHELYINPTDFGISLGKKVEKDGMMVLSEDPNDFVQLGELRMMVNQQVDKFDVNTAVKGIVDNLANKYVKTYGPLKSVDDLRQMEGYDEFKKNYLKALLENPYDASSILTDALGIAPNGESYRFTRNPAEVNENTILVEEGEGGRFVSKINDEQRKQAMDYLDGVFESMVGREEKQIQSRPPTATEIDRGDKQKQDVESMNMIALLYGGDAGQKAQAVQYFGGLNKDILKIDARTNKIKVYKTDGSIVDLDASKDLSEFAKSATELTNVTDVSRAISKADRYNEFKDKGFVQDAAAEITYKELGPTEDEKLEQQKLEVRQKFTREVDKELEPFLTDNYLNQNVRSMEEKFRKTFAAQLRPILAQYKINIVDEYGGGDEMINISAPEKTDSKGNIVSPAINKSMDLYPESNYKAAMETIKAVIEQYTSINEKDSRVSEAAAAAGTGNNQAP